MRVIFILGLISTFQAVEQLRGCQGLGSDLDIFGSYITDF